MEKQERHWLVVPLALAMICANLVYAAIWDNRSVFHTATFDYNGLGDRFGNRAVGLGERPYYDPKSSSRRVALGLDFVQ